MGMNWGYICVLFKVYSLVNVGMCFSVVYKGFWFCFMEIICWIKLSV